MLAHSARWLLLVILTGALITFLSCGEEENNPLGPDNDPPVDTIDTIGPRIIAT